MEVDDTQGANITEPATSQSAAVQMPELGDNSAAAAATGQRGQKRARDSSGDAPEDARPAKQVRVVAAKPPSIAKPVQAAAEAPRPMFKRIVAPVATRQASPPPPQPANRRRQETRAPEPPPAPERKQ